MKKTSLCALTVPLMILVTHLAVAGETINVQLTPNAMDSFNKGVKAKTWLPINPDYGHGMLSLPNKALFAFSAHTESESSDSFSGGSPILRYDGLLPLGRETEQDFITSDDCLKAIASLKPGNTLQITEFLAETGVFGIPGYNCSVTQD